MGNNDTQQNYRVARYFDDIFEAFVTGELDKKTAQQKANELNKMERAYVSYEIRLVKPKHTEPEEQKI